MWTLMAGPAGQRAGFFIGDDFTGFGEAAANVYVGEAGMYTSYEDTGADITPMATETGGVIQFSTTAATDNDEAWLCPGEATSVLGAISDTADADKLTIFETRVRFPAITAQNVFFGLSEEGCAAADTKDDDGDLAAAKDLIGFDVNEDDPDAVAFVYQLASGGLVTPIAITQTLVADTWYKFGFVYDPKAESAYRITVYVDNVANGTYVTGTNIAAATFPDGEELNFLAGIKESAATAVTFDMDWWAFYQDAS